MIKNQNPRSSSEEFNPFPSNGKGKTVVEIVGEHTKELAWQGRILNWTFAFIVAILIVCFIAFITFLLDAWRFHSEVYKQFTDKNIELEQSYRSLKENQLELKIEAIQNELDELKSNASSSSALRNLP